jgi:hypothetical protein
MSSEDMKETQLNYLVVRKWTGKEYKKKRSKNPVVHVYLSVDFFYSVYLEKTNKSGKVENHLKVSFPAETSDLVIKEIENVIEVTYIEKGLLWDSKKKVRLQFTPDAIDEFVMHHQQAKEMLNTTKVEDKSKNTEKPQVKVHQSSIQLNQNPQPIKPEPKKQITMQDFVAKSPEEQNDLKESAVFEDDPMIFEKQEKYLNESGMKQESEIYYDEGLDEIEKNYTSEKFINIDKFNNFLHHKEEIDQDLLEKLENEMLPFRKKIDDMDEVEEIAEDHSENLSVSSKEMK